MEKKIILILSIILGANVLLFAIHYCTQKGFSLSEHPVQDNSSEETTTETEPLPGPLSDYSFLVDAGHGGYDPGGVASDGTVEKNINLAIALKLAEKLRAQGAAVTLTREKDIALGETKNADMDGRLQMAATCNPNYLISIHQNSFPDSSVCGAQVFYQSASESAHEMAMSIQEYISKEADSGNTRVAKKGDDYYIIRKAVCPSIICECGFITNETERALLVSEEYQDKLAEGILQGILHSLEASDSK